MTESKTVTWKVIRADGSEEPTEVIIVGHKNSERVEASFPDNLVLYNGDAISYSTSDLFTP